MIDFTCPDCGAGITTETEFAGMSANCPRCGKDLVVPTPGAISAFPPLPSNHLSAPIPSLTPRQERQLNQFSQPIPLTNYAQDRTSTNDIKELWTKKKLRLAICALMACIVVLKCGQWVYLCYEFRSTDSLGSDDPLFSYYKYAIQIDTYSLFDEPAMLGFGERRSIDRYKRGDEYVFCKTDSSPPFTGWVKREFDGKGRAARRLWHITKGRLDKVFEWDLNCQLEEEVTYDVNTLVSFKIEKEREDADLKVGIVYSDSRNFSRSTGILSYRRWTSDGKIDPDTNVIGGNGIAAWYDRNHEWGVIEVKDGVATERSFRDLHPLKPQRSKYQLESSPDFEMGFVAGVTKKFLPYDDPEAYEAGKAVGRTCESSRVYTAGLNRGREEAATHVRIRSNPYNEHSEKVEWLTWNMGYNVGNMQGVLSR